ncbi:MAG: DUF1641 domain-containing protein, partial [Myxococcota bacterium]
VETPAATQERLSQTLLLMVEPEALESIGNIITVLPQLEYLVHAAAAGPELLEEGLELVRHNLAEKGLDHAALQQRLQAALDAVDTLSEPKALRALQATAATLPTLRPLVEAAGQAVQTLTEAEGEEALQARLAQALVDLGGKDRWDALMRLAEHAVELEPVLAAVAKNVTVERMDMLFEMLQVVDDAEIREAVVSLLQLSPRLSKPLEALPVQDSTLQVLASANNAVGEAAHEKRSLGMLGILGALRHPDMQRAAGFGVSVAMKIGGSLNRPLLSAPKKNGKATNGKKKSRPSGN